MRFGEGHGCGWKQAGRLARLKPGPDDLGRTHVAMCGSGAERWQVEAFPRLVQAPHGTSLSLQAAKGERHGTGNNSEARARTSGSFA